jgi:cation diffusion facilitator family transporter
MDTAQKGSYKLKTLKISTIAISTVVFVEITLGLLIGSLAILSDGAHALLDSLTMLVLLLTTRASLKPPDEEHMYGHEKFEPIGGLIGGIALIGIALLIMYEAILRLTQNASINLGLESAGFIAIGYTLCIDFLRIGILRKALESESSTMKAGFYHALADFSSTIIALLGFGLATIGFKSGDALASVVLSILLAYLSIRLVWSSGMELSDTVSRDDVKRIQSELAKAEANCKCENLKVRKSGEKFFVEATLKVPNYVSLEEAHDITAKIEANIRSVLGKVDTTIHIEPAETHEMPTKKLIEKLATEVSGVKEVHEINTAYSKGKLYITLHALVDPKLSVQEAHEIAEKIEKKIKEAIRELENLTVHIEPFDVKVQKGLVAEEEEIRRIIYKTAKNYLKALRLKRIVTYVVDKKRYINIDCCFEEHISITEAHQIASDIEENIKKNFAETIVTVHVEPHDKEKRN